MKDASEFFLKIIDISKANHFFNNNKKVMKICHTLKMKYNKWQKETIFARNCIYNNSKNKARVATHLEKPVNNEILGMLIWKISTEQAK